MEVLALLESSGSQLGANLPPGDVWQCRETFLIVKSREEPVLLVSIGQRPGVPLNILQIQKIAPPNPPMKK